MGTSSHTPSGALGPHAEHSRAWTATDEMPLLSEQLMELAGLSCAAAIHRFYPVRAHSITVRHPSPL